MPSPAQVVLSMATAYRTSQLVYVAAKLGLADILAQEPQSCEEMAARLEASPDALCRLMRGLAMLGLFASLGGDRYGPTPYSETLRSGVQGSVRSGVLYWGAEQYHAWGELAETVMTGEPAFRRMFGSPFEHYDRSPAASDAFDSFMTASTRLTGSAIASNYEFPAAGTVVDVAGGEGILLSKILQANRGLKGVLFDRASVVKKARRLLADEGVLARCRLVAGDCRRSVPRLGDVYVLRNVLHDWDDSAAREILTACRRAMKKTSRLLVIQRALPEPIDLADPYVQSVIDADLMQMVYNGGRERTVEEYRALIDAAGMRIDLTMAASGHVWLMEARKA